MLNRRQYTRITRDYRLEYGPFAAVFFPAPLTATRVKNVSGSGVLFSAHEQLPVGSKIVMSIYVSGWKQENGSPVPCPDHGSELHLQAIAEIVRVEHDEDTGCYRTGARFVGRLH